jgi:hypothetical protein
MDIPLGQHRPPPGGLRFYGRLNWFQPIILCSAGTGARVLKQISASRERHQCLIAACPPLPRCSSPRPSSWLSSSFSGGWHDRGPHRAIAASAFGWPVLSAWAVSRNHYVGPTKRTCNKGRLSGCSFPAERVVHQMIEAVAIVIGLFGAGISCSRSSSKGWRLAGARSVRAIDVPAGFLKNEIGPPDCESGGPEYDCGVGAGFRSAPLVGRYRFSRLE